MFNVYVINVITLGAVPLRFTLDLISCATVKGKCRHIIISDDQMQLTLFYVTCFVYLHYILCQPNNYNTFLSIL